MLTGQIYFKRATFLFSFPKKSNLQTDDKKNNNLAYKKYSPRRLRGFFRTVKAFHAVTYYRLRQ